MRCQYCNKKLERSWNFCPKCGRRAEKPVSLFNLVNKIFSGNNIHHSKNPNEIVINLTPGFSNKMSVRNITKNKVENRKTESRKFNGDVSEPNAEVRRTNQKIFAEIDLPGITKLNDIKIDRIYDSSEIKAYGKSNGYFKILDIPKRYRLIKKNLKNEKLELEFSI